MARSGTSAFLALFGLTAASGCPSLDPIPLGQCGNGVIETSRGEECDTPAEAEPHVAGKPRCAAPGEPGECHFVWDAEACCPSGSFAGADGRCRSASSVLAPLAESVLPDSARTADVGDVDGDQWPDLLLAFDNNDLDLLQFHPGGTVRGRVVVQRAQESKPVLASLADPRPRVVGACTTEPELVGGPDALLLPSSSGVRILLGREGPTLLTKALAAFELLQPARVAALPLLTCVGSAGYGTLLPEGLKCPGTLVDRGGALEVDAVTIVDPDAAQEGGIRRRHRFSGVRLADLAEPPRHLRLPGWGGCDALAFWFGPAGGGPARVEVIGFCDPEVPEDERSQGRLLANVTLRPGARPVFLDVTADGELDLVVVDETEARVLVGDGAGSFEEDGATPPTRTPQIAGAGDDAPLTVGFLDDDAYLDFVQPYAVWASDGTCALDAAENRITCDHALAAIQIPDANALWTEAAIVDLNDDGRADVVAARESVAGGNHAVDLLMANESGILSAAPLPTERPPRYLIQEDLDGDAFVDVGYVVPAASSCAEPDELFVRYGGPSPSEPVLVAELPGIQSVASSPLIFAPDSFDGVGDLGIGTTCTSPEGLTRNQIAVLLGTTTRRLDAPFPLSGAADDGRTLFASGDLDADGHPDLVAVTPLTIDDSTGTMPAPLALWRFPFVGEAEPVSPARVPDVALPLSVLLLPDFDREDQLIARSRVLLRAGLAVGQLDCEAGGTEGDRCKKQDVAVFLSSQATAEGDVDVPLLAVMPGLDGVPTVAPSPALGCGVPGGGSLPEVLSKTVAGYVNYATTPKRTQLHLADVDGDGWTDAVGWWFGPRTVEGGEITDATLVGGAVVFWNGPPAAEREPFEHDGFAAGCPVAFPVPAGETIVRVASFRGAKGTSSLLVATPRAVRLAQPGAERDLGACAREGEGDACRLLHEVDLRDGGGAIRDVAVMDFDQDGLDDLVVVRDVGVELRAQLPIDELDVEGVLFPP